jgi:DNA primase
LTEDGATLLSKYTDQVVLIFDGDAAGQDATRRAIPILEKAGLQVKVLQIKDAKDPDEFLKAFGADKFKVLLEGSSNRVEFQLNAIRRKYDLRVDAQKVDYIHESAQLLSTLDSSIQREIYGHRVAEEAGISYDALKLEVDRAFKRRIAKEKKQQEKVDLAPARNLQPRARSIRYDNMRSAMAEETVIALVLKEPALLDRTGSLQAEAFSSPLLGKVFAQLQQRHRDGLDVSVAVLAELSGEEMSHIVGISQRQDGPVNETALDDCIRIIRAEHESGSISSDDALLAYRNKLKESKGVRP